MQKNDRLLWVLFLVGLGFALGYIAAAKQESAIVKDGWDIASAVGTVGAVLVALLLGVPAYFRAVHERQTRMLIAATLARGPLRELRGQLGYMIQRLESYVDAVHGVDAFINSPVFQAVHNPLVTFSVDDVLPFRDLDADVAYDLANAISFARELAGLYAIAARPNYWNGVGAEQRAFGVAGFLALARNTSKHTLAAIERLEKLLGPRG